MGPVSVLERGSVEGVCAWVGWSARLEWRIIASNIVAWWWLLGGGAFAVWLQSLYSLRCRCGVSTEFESEREGQSQAGPSFVRKYSAIALSYRSGTYRSRSAQQHPPAPPCRPTTRLSTNPTRTHPSALAPLTSRLAQADASACPPEITSQQQISSSSSSI
jgi:hypothetical protein